MSPVRVCLPPAVGIIAPLWGQPPQCQAAAMCAIQALVSENSAVLRPSGGKTGLSGTRAQLQQFIII